MATMKSKSLILTSVFALAMLPAAVAQSTTSQDPSTQPSATPTQSQTNPTSQQPSETPSTATPSSSSSDAQRSFVGSIAKTGGKYVLHTGGSDYQLDDQAQAGKFEGKDVKVTGQLDQSSNTIKVASIEPSSSM
jgi:hypothetical protein